MSRCSFGGGTRACGRLTAWLIVSINLIAFAIQPALGQQRQGLFGNRSRRQSAPRPAILERNAPIENLLRKADSAISRQDWKLAIDSLQRILDDPGGALLRADAPRSDGSAGMTMFESAQDRATLLLASMPTEGIEAYRLLHDGQAKALYKRGVEDCDETALRTILARYMVSSYGDDAGDVVVGWLLDRNRPAEAVELLDRIDRVCKDSDISPARFGVKRAAAWTMLHDQTQAEEALASLSSDGNIDGQEGFDLSALRRFVRGGWPTTLSTSVSAGRESWPVLGGDLRRRFQMPAVTPELLGNLPWRFVLPADHDYPSWWEAFWESSEGETRGYPVGEFVISEGRLFVKSLRQIVALDFESLDPLWVSHRCRPRATSEQAAKQTPPATRIGGQQFQRE
ncbi:MAG: hypothetical protein GXP29_15780 [Planctomycetes bacterium]|nr:hypothetical protein [Planctomycetota bacterium]